MSLQSKQMRKFSQKVTGRLFDYYGIVQNDNKSYEYLFRVIFNIKKFYLDFCLMKFSKTDILQNSQGINKGRKRQLRMQHIIKLFSILQLWIINNEIYKMKKVETLHNIIINIYAP